MIKSDKKSDQNILDAYLTLGMALQEAKEYDEAYEILKRAVSRYNESADAHLALGLTLLENEKLTESIDILKKSIELTRPEDKETLAIAYFSLGIIYRRQKN